MNASDMNDLPPRNHNNPPDPLLLEADERVANANRWLTERPEITDVDMADKAAFAIEQITATFNALDGQRLQEGRDFKKVQDAKYANPLRLLELAKNKMVALRRQWLLKEQARLDIERAAAEAEAKRKADEAAKAKVAAEALTAPLQAVLESELTAQAAQEAAEKAAAIPERATIKGALSSKATGLRTVWLARITNRAEAFRHYKADPVLLAAIDEAMLRLATKDAVAAKDTTKAPAGVEFYSEQR